MEVDMVVVDVLGVGILRPTQAYLNILSLWKAKDSRCQYNKEMKSHQILNPLHMHNCKWSVSMMFKYE